MVGYRYPVVIKYQTYYFIAGTVGVFVSRGVLLCIAAVVVRGLFEGIVIS